MSLVTPTIGALANRAIISPLSNPQVRQALFQTGGRVANFVMKRAANRIKRAWRARNRRGYRAAKRQRRSYTKKSNVGRRARAKFADPVGSSNCKRVEFNEGPVLKNTRQLYVTSLTTLTKGDANNQRERSIINCRGIRIRQMFRSANAAGVNEIGVNVAVISPKDCIATTPTGANFFRANDAFRWRDFDDTMSGWLRMQQNINTDNYLVHYHKRFLLADFDVGNGTRYLKMRKRWLKISRQLRYEDKADGNSSEPVNGAIYLVWWCDGPQIAANTQGDGGVGGRIDNALTYAHDCVMYYKETGTY